jgi:DNA uptake protein ComE-like DNA-binding protein
MNVRSHNQAKSDAIIRAADRHRCEAGSVLVIVLLIAIGLISMALYFANSMTMELRAADNRTSGLAAEQAIEGAARYVSSILSANATNGVPLDRSEYQANAVPVGNSTRPEENAHFWIIGRDPESTLSTEPYFALTDESAKLNLNAGWLTTDGLATNLPRMTYEFAEALIDWRDTNASDSSLNYSQAGYLPKHAPFETVAELRLVFGATMEILAGDDRNENGVLDANETDLDSNGQLDPGVLEDFTVYSREPNTHSDGSSLTNVNERAALQSLLEARLGTSRATSLQQSLALIAGPGTDGNGGIDYTNLLQFFLQYQRAGMTADEFATIYSDITATTNTYTTGRVNINTASAAVLACIPGLDSSTAQQIVSYRESNSGTYSSIAWIVDALGANSPALQALSRGDYITTKSYQVAADVAAVGPFGRGYRRVRFIFDLSDGTPKIVFRQDLSRLGWALGRQTRQTWVAANTR